MSSQKRKLYYLTAMIPVYVVVFLLSLPATKERPPGWLYQMRESQGLGDVTLGELDPTSHTLNFVLVGMRGVAANVLWQEAHKLQERHQWNELKRCIRSITLLQPHFVKVWDFQGWNLAYNVSNEWDNVEDRYYWIKEGIKFLQDGFAKNPKRPELPFQVGKTYANKIGQADESVQFRRLFKEDKEFNPNGADNYRVAKEWFERAMLSRDELRLFLGDESQFVGSKPRLGTSPVVFNSALPLAQAQYAEVIEEEGTFGEAALLAWRTALEDWQQFGEVHFKALDVGEIKLEYSPTEWGSLNHLEKYWTGRYRSIVNYEGWKSRCEAESWVEKEQMTTVEARRLTYLANAAYDEGDLIRARTLYEQAMPLWKRAVEAFDYFLKDDGFVMQYATNMNNRYRLILIHLGELTKDGDLPLDFPLRALWDRNEQIQQMIQVAQQYERTQPGQQRGMGGGQGAGTGGGDSNPREQKQQAAEQEFQRLERERLERQERQRQQQQSQQEAP